MADQSDAPEATEPEGDEEIEAYIGAPLDADYLADLSKESD